MSVAYHRGNRGLQDPFDTRRTATEAFVEARDMFFIAAWKMRDRSRDALPQADPAYDPSREVIER